MAESWTSTFHRYHQPWPTKEAKAAIGEALKKFAQDNPDAIKDEAGLSDHHDIGH